MARPQKIGLEYAPFDTSYDINYQLIIANFGFTGIGFIDTVYREVYRNGYYLQITDDIVTLMAHMYQSSDNEIQNMLTHAIKYGFFDGEIFNQYKIITSADLQHRFIHAILKRTSLIMYTELILVNISLPEYSRLQITTVSMFSNPLDSTIPQSKLQTKPQKTTANRNDSLLSRSMQEFIKNAK